MTTPSTHGSRTPVVPDAGGRRARGDNGMSWDTGPEWGRPRHSDAVLLAAGMADLAAGAPGSVLGGLRGLLRRSDVADPAGEGQQEIKARGRLVLDRYASGPPAHLEVLARQVTARRSGAADVRMG
ncbi:hypothetical protein GCM10010346_17960 [Streptomyces chryseus]|uniref:Polyprenyl synthetase n=2 Tax=Streptomyces chryseus TaxID=68186 RepID=A0ABQ3DJ04_9ACTN|nr:hypothetical protein GCM10010346_17960 [Streptomyces chryseus]